MASSCNWANQTIWTGDNLPIMRGMNSASVDLIYLDPPFNSKANYAAPIGSKAAGAAFKDTWALSDVDAEWVNLMEAKHPALHRVLLAAMTPSDKSYLAYMAVRLLELRRILKPTGSIYLHCDPTMSHYLKLVMDAVFGKVQFRNEVMWVRAHPKGLAFTRFASSHDVILAYARERREATWNAMYVPNPRQESQYRMVESGTGRRYQLTSLLNPNKDRPNLDYEFKGVRRVWRWSKARMRQADRDGLIVVPRGGEGVPRLKRYMDEQKGIPVGDAWTDIPFALGHERTGYPTQKPLALLDRIIKASSNEGDLVLDPFCGCATTLVAAELADRRWAGIDIGPKAAELVVRRLQSQGEGGGAGEIGPITTIGVIHRKDIPKRTDLGRMPPYRSHKPTLYGLQSGNCAGCAEHFEARHLEVDHIISRAKGGTDHIENLQLLCASCNRIKGDRGMEYLRTKLQL